MKIKSLFYKIYFSVIAVFAVLLVVMLISLNGWLGNYEAAQPDALVNKIVNEYVTANNVYGLNSISQLKLSPYETKEGVNAYFKALTSGKEISASSAVNRIEGSDLAYTVKADDQKILNVYLKKKEGSSSFLATYEVMSVALPDDLYKNAQIVIPEGAEVAVNGVALKAEDKTAVQLPNIPEKYKNGISGGSIATLENLVSENLTVTATANGNPLTVTQSDTQYIVAQDIDEATVTKITDFAKEASETYSAYMQNDSSMTAIKKYFATDTEFYDNLRKTDVIFALDHNGYRFEDVIAHDIYRFSDNLYKTRITLTQILVKGGSQYKDYFDKNVYIYVNGDTMSVIDLRSSGESHE